MRVAFRRDGLVRLEGFVVNILRLSISVTLAVVTCKY